VKLGTKLLLAPVLTAAVALGAGQINSQFAKREMAALQAQRLAQDHVNEALADTVQQVSSINAGMYRAVALMSSWDAAKVTAVRADLAQQLAGVQKSLGSIAKLPAAGEAGAKLQGQLGQVSSLIAKFQKQADDAIDMASVDPNTGIAALQSSEATFKTLANELGAIKKRVDDAATEANHASQARSNHSQMLISAAGALASLMVLGLVWFVLRQVMRDLKRAGTVASEVAAGRLDQVVDHQRQDEVGDLLRSLVHMQTQLRQVVGSVRGAAESVASASLQFAQGNQDLSMRTEEQASALQQTAASVEQLGGIAQGSADHACQANALASGASSVAVQGGVVVGKVVNTMKAINESSQKIADIISVIDGIAFQTNILALNAAVEAARAGEQGRGFAVVAAEVRILAGRSASAANEIKNLINASAQRVQQGSAEVKEAGATMTQIVSSIQRVTDIVSDISRASSTQSQGVVQVREALTQIDQNTQQNAALVEQSAAAAMALQRQAQQLLQAVAVFRLGEERAAAS
jgi:methyl-accepting chemotaxis protein